MKRFKSKLVCLFVTVVQEVNENRHSTTTAFETLQSHGECPYRVYIQNFTSHVFRKFAVIIDAKESKLNSYIINQ